MPASPFCSRASWIWSSEATHAVPTDALRSPSHYQVRRFRREVRLGETAGAGLSLSVSADSRYVLYLNGTIVARGPAKGDVRHQFYDTLELGPRLRPGLNVLAALVIDMSRVAHRPSQLGAPCSVMTYTGGFLLEGELVFADGASGERIDTGLPGWRVAGDSEHRFQNEGTRFEGYHGYFEHRKSDPCERHWTDADYDAAAWQEATVLYAAERLEHRRDPASPYGLVERLIPPLEEDRIERFRDAFCAGGAAAGPGWARLLSEDAPLELPPDTLAELVLDCGELTTAYPSLCVSGGAGATLRLTYAEALRMPWGTPDARLLGRRQPLANLASHFADEETGWTFDRRGRVTGWCDIWEPSGAGTTAAPEPFEPLHWRAFRYVGLRIETGAAPLVLHAVRHRFTAYPYRVQASFECSDKRLNRLWSVGVRTMRLCSHETFEDCPHYEQMQYAGDTMITSRLAMLATGDARLTRQALLQFDWSRIPEGLTQSRYPSRLEQVIPSWSLHWITTARDYVYHTGDLDTARGLLPGLAAVLDWFRRHGDAAGLPARLPYWNITDWCPWWPRGVVPGADTGPTAIIAAQYIQALDEVADLASLLGNDSLSDSLIGEAGMLRSAFVRAFWSERDGLFFDRPGGPEVSQYGNAWAIVCGAALPEHRVRMLERFPNDASLAPGSFFCWHAVFRALAVCGRYDGMPGHLGPWHEMVDSGLSTFVEENSYWRSLCHAWSAHPVLEFATRVLGITPRRPGYAEISVAPLLCGLESAAGRVCTPRGMVSVSWRFSQGVFSIEIDAPAGTPVHVELPGGRLRQYPGGRYKEEVSLS